MHVRDDVVPALEELRACGIKIGVVSDAPYGMTAEIFDKDIQASGLEHLIDHRVISSQVGFRKPSPESFARLLELAGVVAEESVSLGNEEKDLRASMSAGIRAVLFAEDNTSLQWPAVVSSIESFVEYVRSL